MISIVFMIIITTLNIVDWAATDIKYMKIARIIMWLSIIVFECNLVCTV